MRLLGAALFMAFCCHARAEDPKPVVPTTDEKIATINKKMADLAAERDQLVRAKLAESPPMQVWVQDGCGPNGCYGHFESVTSGTQGVATQKSLRVGPIERVVQYSGPACQQCQQMSYQQMNYQGYQGQGCYNQSYNQTGPIRRLIHKMCGCGE